MSVTCWAKSRQGFPLIYSICIKNCSTVCYVLKNTFFKCKSNIKSCTIEKLLGAVTFKQ